MQTKGVVAAALVLAAAFAIPVANQTGGEVATYSYEFVRGSGEDVVTTDFSEMCAGGKMQVARRLFKFAVCHSTNDQVGRRKRKPKPECPFAVVGIRATIVLDQLAHNLENTFGLPEGQLSNLKGVANQFRSTFHQSFVYGDEHGYLDFASGFFCGEGTMWGRQWGFICQDDDRLVQMYVPITNDTLALDNWFPVQYNLVGRKFDCDRLWRAEMELGKKYDACAHPDTAVDYSAVVRNCHMYVNEVVLLYDKMTAQEGPSPVDLQWSHHETATLHGMTDAHTTPEALAKQVDSQLAAEQDVWAHTAQQQQLLQQSQTQSQPQQQH